MNTSPQQLDYTIEGLSGPADIVVDRWGVPHITATSRYDAYRAQGFNAARDRLWQLDLWRRRGLGLLSEVFGPDLVERDRAARLFLYRGDMQPEWLAYHSDTKRIATAFVEGINAYIRLTCEDSTLLPVEFREMGYRPSVWSPSDVVRIRNQGLSYNLRQEVARALIIRDYGVDVENLRAVREPWHELHIPDGLDLALVPDDVLHVYELAMGPLPFVGNPWERLGGPVEPEGSNNWVVSGGLTRSGRPILSDDPHRKLQMPSLRYLAHLTAPGMDIIGGGEPTLPGLTIGHNGHIAFGLTIFPIDQEDLYVYETNPENPLEYRYQDGWESMRIERTTIDVKGASSVTADLAFTRHGPVIYADPERRTAFAVRAAWLLPGMAPYLGGLALMDAKNWDEFGAAMNRWGTPPENQIYADVDGNIGWRAGGRTPIRPNWDGTLPVPGDGRYEWAGFYDGDDLPGSFNPETGWIATANECNLPPDFPKDRTITFDWYPAHRRERIGHVLDGATNLTVDDMVALQTDYVSTPAQQILARMAQLPVRGRGLDDAIEMLLAWDCNLTAESGPGALFEIWYRRHFRPALLSAALRKATADHLHKAAFAAILPQDDRLADARVDLSLLYEPGARLGPDPEGLISDLIISSLHEATAEAEALLGPDRDAWAWGRLHQVKMQHPLHSLLQRLPEEQRVIGPLPRGGSSDTVGNTRYTPDFMQSGGATFRVVIDVGDWDQSVAMNAPGQSGDPRSEHYSDLFEAWATDGSFPLLYSRECVLAAARLHIRLHPA